MPMNQNCKGSTCRCALLCLALAEEITIRFLCPKCKSQTTFTLFRWDCQKETVYNAHCVHCGYSTPICGEGSLAKYHEMQRAFQ